MPRKTERSGSDATHPSLTLTAVTQAVLVGEYRSFRRAAAALGVRQSAVSKGVRTLEESLGVALFERRQGGVRLTNAGAIFIEQVGEALTQIRSAAKTAILAGAGNRGQLRIGIQTSIGGGCLRELIDRYHSQHPNVDIRFLEASAGDCVAGVRKRQLDVAFCTASGKMKGLEVSPLWHERIFAILPKTHGIAARTAVEWTDLGDQRVIVLHLDRDPTLCNEVKARIEATGGRALVETVDVGRETLMHMVEMGFGIGLTTEASIGAPWANLVFRPIAGDAGQLQFNAIWLAHNDNPALRRFMSLARTVAKERRRALSQQSIGPRTSLTGGINFGLALLAALSRRLGLST